MSISDELEDKGVNIEKLTVDERQTYFTMLSAVQESQLSLEKLRDHIIEMRSAVELELIKEPEFTRVFIFKFENRNQIFLKARLKNYMLLESFLISPDKAKRSYNDMVATIKERVK